VAGGRTADVTPPVGQTDVCRYECPPSAGPCSNHRPCGVLPLGVELLEDHRADLAGFDLAAAAPEDVGVEQRDVDVGQVFVDRGLVGEHGLLVGAVDDAHDVHIGKALAAFTPVAVGHDGMTADFAASTFFHALRHTPVEKSVEAGDTLAAGAGLHMLEEGGEAADNAFFVELLGHFAEAFEAHAGVLGTSGPGLGADLLGLEVAFEVEEHVPLLRIEVGDVGGHHLRRFVGLFAGFHGLATDVAHAEGKDAMRLHGVVVLGTDEALQHIAVSVDVAVLRHFEGGPKAEVAAADLPVGAAKHDVTAERVLLEKEVEGGVELVRRQLPGDEGPLGQLVGKQGLSHTTNDAGGEHGADAFHDGVKGHAALLRDELEGMLVEALHAVLAHGEDLGVHGIGMFGGEIGVGHGRR